MRIFDNASSIALTRLLALTGLPLFAAMPAILNARTAARPDLQPVEVVFACDAPAGHTCYFTAVNASGTVISKLTIGGGGRASKRIKINNSDNYTVTVDRDFTHDRTCETATKAGAFCKHAALVAGYNN